MTNLQKLTTEYAKLVAKENDIDAHKKSIAIKISEHITAMGMTSATMPQGVFSIIPKNEWTFSKKVQKEEEKLQAMKDTEKERGIAQKKTISTSLRFTPKK